MCDVHDIPYNFLFTPNVNIDGFINVTNTNVCPQPKYMVFVSCSSNTTGVTSGAGAACSAGSPEFPFGFYWGSCCSVFSILCSFLQIMVCSFVLYFLVIKICVLFRLTTSHYSFGIFNFCYSTSISYILSFFAYFAYFTDLMCYKQLRVITKLPNSEQSYKGKVKTHRYINRQNQSTTGKL